MDRRGVAINEAALNTFGEMPKTKDARPWIQGRETELATLERATAMARRWFQHTTQGQRPWPEQQSAAVAGARVQQREANRLKRAIPKKWEEEWWLHFAEDAEASAMVGDM